MFWRDYELAIFNLYAEEYKKLDFTLNLMELQVYVQALFYLNKPGLCTFATSGLTPLFEMIKVFMTRIETIEGENYIKAFFRMVTTLSSMPLLKD